MKRYFNLKTSQGTETVDEVNRQDFNSHKEFIAELRRLKQEYNMAGMLVYTSQRCCKDWNE